MNGPTRNSGIGALGQVAWGTHFCQFYKDRKDLLDILLPYFRAGLENNEFCMWVCSEPLQVDQARAALKKAVPRFNRYEQRGQVEILDHARWYLHRGVFDSQRVLRGWVAKLNRALARGYDGLRLSGNTFWLEKKDWKRFTEYEEEVDAVIGRYPMIALCTYSLDRCGAGEVIDVINNHQHTLIRRGGRWTRVESAGQRKAHEDLLQSEQRFIEIFTKSPLGIEIYDGQGALVDANPACLRIFGVAKGEDVQGIKLFDDPNLTPEVRAKLQRGQSVSFQSRFDFERAKQARLYPTAKSGQIDIEVRITPLRNGGQRGIHGYLVQVADVTQLKRDQAAAEESRKKLEALFDSDIIGVFIADSERILEANKAFLKIVGRSQKHVQSGELDWKKITPPEFAVLDDLREKRLRSGRNCPPYEKEYLRPDGTRVPVTVGAALLSRSPLQWACYVIDTTPRKRAEEARRASEKQAREQAAHLQAVLDSTPALIWIANDRDCRSVTGNKASYRILRVPPGKDLSKSGSQVNHLSHFRVFSGGVELKPEEMPLQRVAASGRILRDYSMDIVFDDGNVRSLTGDVVPLFDASGLPNGAVGAFIDITLRKKTEEALRESEERHRLLFESMLQGVVYQDVKGKIVAMNPAAEQILGRTPKDFLGQTSVDQEPLTVRPDGSPFPGLEHPSMVALRTGQKTSGVMMGIFNPREKRRRWISISAVPLFRPGEAKPYQVYTLFDDITERRRIEEELIRSKQELEQRVEERTVDLSRAVEQVRQNEALLRNVLETLPVGVWLTDREGKIYLGNKAGQEIWAGEKLVGIDQYGEYKGWWADSGRRIEPEEWAAARAVTRGETSINEEVEIECFDGSRKFILNSALPIRDQNDRITGAIIVNQDITARRKGESALQEQAALLDLAHDAVVSTDLDGTIRYWNHGAELLYGWTKEEARGRICHDLLQTKFPELLKEIIANVVRAGRWEGELVHRHRDGHPLTVSSRWALKRDKTGNPQGVLEINTDISEHKRAEEALRAVSLYTRSLIEASLDPLVTISPDGKIMDVNQATELATGVSREALIGSDFSNYFTEPTEARKGYEKVFQKGSVRDYPLAIRHVSGQVAEVLYNASVYRNSAGEVQGVFAAARDITERKQAEEESLRLAKALEQAAEGVVIMNPDRTVLYVNPAGERIYSLIPGQTPGKRYDDVLLGAAQANIIPPRLGEALKQGKPWTGRLTLKKQGGENIEADIVISPVLDAEGQIKNFVAVARDVTEEVRLQNHVRQRQKMEALGTLAGGVAHDFNNILMPIMINAEMALMEDGLGQAAARHLGLVIEAANRGKGLVNQIIAFSRPKDQERAAVEVVPVIREALKFLRASIPANIDLQENIITGEAMTVADPTQIHQVLMNLGSNAAYAMRAKGGVLKLGLDACEIREGIALPSADLSPGPYLRISVSDTGCGMSPEILERIFEPFFTTKEPGEGTGMGLSVALGIVKSHGGDITVYSEPGQGSVFHVYLPQAGLGRAVKIDLPKPVPRGTERVLFIDDEEIHIKSIVPMLERLGYKATGQTDPRRALELFRKSPEDFDVVITDQTMPGLTGVELAKQLRHIRPGLPIILCTGFSDTGYQGKLEEIGIRAFLMKPFSIREIAEAIRGVLKTSS